MISQDGLQEWFQRRRLAKSFLRWAGGKQPFLNKYGGMIPRFHGNYVEPFLGSGATFFYVQRTQSRPTQALLGDNNLQLVLTYYAVRDEPERVSRELDKLRDAYLAAPDRRGFYEDIRDQYNAELPGVDAAKFLFLNRTCWNGLYRTNRQGQFNVPHGTPKGDPTFPALADLLNASAALQQAQLRASSWETVLAAANVDDFAFIDPPYYSDILAGDQKYGRKTFDLDSHRRLARALVDLSQRGVDFLLTNSGEDEVVEMYRSCGFHVERTRVPRFISSDVDNRSAAHEIAVTPRPPLRIV